MKFRVFTLVALLFLNLSYGMEKPSVLTQHKAAEPEIPAGLRSLYDEEIEKFNKYERSDPLALLNKEIQEIEKTDNFKSFSALEYKRKILSMLFKQHLVMDVFNTFTYVRLKYNDINQKLKDVLKKLGSDSATEKPSTATNRKKERVGKFFARFHLETLDGIAMLLSIPQDLLTNDIIEFEEIKKVAFPLKADENEEIRQLGSLLEQKYLLQHICPIALDETKRCNSLGCALLDIVITNKQLSFYLKNSRLQKELYQEYLQFEKSPIKNKPIGEGDSYFLHKFSALAHLYKILSPRYQQLYETLYADYEKRVKELAESSENKINLLSHFEIYYPTPPAIALKEEKKLPTYFPKTLSALKDAVHSFSLFSLDEEYNEFLKTHVAQQEPSLMPIKKPKKKKHKKKQQSLFPAVESTSLKEEEISEPSIPEIQETSTKIIIQDLRNEATEIIFKSNHPNTVQINTAPAYTPWVDTWFNNPAQAIKEQGYTDPKNKKFTQPHLHWKAITLHAFSPLIDTYLAQWGTQGTIASRKTFGQQDILLTLPGAIVYKTGEQEVGLFTYIIDAHSGKWYHRMFTPESSQRLFEDLFSKGYFSPEITGYYDIAFPPLP